MAKKTSKFTKGGDLSPPLIYVAVLYGEPGVGKSMCADDIDDPIFIIDAEEGRAEMTAHWFYPNKLFEIRNIIVREPDRYGKLELNPLKSFQKIDRALEDLSKEYIDDVESIILEGAHNIRYLAILKYEAQEKKKAYGKRAYGMINNWANEVFKTIIGYGRKFQKNIIITTQRFPKYEKTGEKDTYGEWVEEQMGWDMGVKPVVGHDVDIIIYFRYMDTPTGRVRVASFDKHSIVGEISLTLGFKDFRFRDMKRVHALLKRQKKNRNRKSLPELFGDGCFDMTTWEQKEAVCLSCGARLPVNSKFCHFCGKMIKEIEPKKKTTPKKSR